MMRNTTMLISEHLRSDERHFRQGDDGNGARSSNSDAPPFSWCTGPIEVICGLYSDTGKIVNYYLGYTLWSSFLGPVQGGFRIFHAVASHDQLINFAFPPRLLKLPESFEQTRNETIKPYQLWKALCTSRSSAFTRIL